MPPMISPALKTTPGNGSGFGKQEPAADAGGQFSYRAMYTVRPHFLRLYGD